MYIEWAILQITDFSSTRIREISCSNHSLQQMYYREVQRFNQWYFIVLHLLILGSGILILYSEYLAKPVTNPTDPEPFLFFVLLVLINIFLICIQLEAVLSEKGMSVRYFPFASEFHPWENIQQVEVVTLPFSGPGIRWSDDYGLIYNVRGNKGVFVICHNGEKYIIGSSNPEKLAMEIRKRLTRGM